jgi:hypothetical protein
MTVKPIRSGMTFYSSFPNVSIGNPEHSELMDPHFHGDDKKKMGVREEVDSASKKSRKN